MTKKALVLASFVFLFGLYATKVVSASSVAVSSTHSHLYAADDEENKGLYDDYHAGEDFYIWTTTESKVA